MSFPILKKAFSSQSFSLLWEKFSPLPLQPLHLCEVFFQGRKESVLTPPLCQLWPCLLPCPPPVFPFCHRSVAPPFLLHQLALLLNGLYFCYFYFHCIFLLLVFCSLYLYFAGFVFCGLLSPSSSVFRSSSGDFCNRICIGTSLLFSHCIRLWHCIFDFSLFLMVVAFSKWGFK